MRSLHKHLINRPLLLSGIFLLLAAILTIPIVVSALTPTFTEYPTPGSSSNPFYIINGPDGNLWFIDDAGVISGTAYVGKANPINGNITEYALPAGSDPLKPIIGPDGNIWTVEDLTHSLDKVTTGGTISRYPLTNAVFDPSGDLAGDLTVGPDGNLWMAINETDTIAVLNTQGQLLKSYTATTEGLPDASPDFIATGPDNNIWYSQKGLYDKIDKMNPCTGAVTEYTIPGDNGLSNQQVSGITVGPDKNIWFTSYQANLIGKIVPSTGVFTIYPDNITNGKPMLITSGPDGNIWFSEESQHIASINPSSGTITQYNTPTPGGTEGIAAGPDNNIWYTDANTAVGHIGKANIGGSGSNPAKVPSYNANYCQSSSGSGSSGSSGGSGSSSGNGSNGSGSDGNSGSQGQNSQGSGSKGSSGNSGSQGQNSNGEGSQGKNSQGNENNKSAGTDTSDTTLPPAPTANQGDKDTKDKVVMTIENKGTVKAEVAVGVNLSRYSYTVPDMQVLYVDGSLGQVVVKKGGTVKGTGAMQTLSVDSGGVLSPGHSPGCLTADSITFMGEYAAQLGGKNPCTGFDQLIASNTVSLYGSLDVSLIDNLKPSIGQIFTIIKNTSKYPIVGTFAGLPEGSVFSTQGITYSISYRGGSGNDVVLKVIKNASSAASSAKNTKFSYAILKHLKDDALLIGVVVMLLILAIVFAVLHIHKKAKNKGNDNNPNIQLPVNPNPQITLPSGPVSPN